MGEVRTAQRRACYVGPQGPLHQCLASALMQKGYSLRPPDPEQTCDLVVDATSCTAADLRAVFATLPASVSHYILLSTHQVYPATPTLRPWNEDSADVAFDLPNALSVGSRMGRATERELRLLARNRLDFTILRPSLIEGSGGDGSLVTQWCMDRVLHGGVLVLPEGDMPSYRHVSYEDIAQAIATVAGQAQAFGRALNVTNSATLSYWGHAAMVRDCLGQPLRFGYVSDWRWRAANLKLPLGERGSSSFIEPSALLHALGWRAQNPFETLSTSIQNCRKSATVESHAVLALERHILAQTEAESLYRPGISEAPLPASKAPQWALRGFAGQPGSLAMERLPHVQAFPNPVVKVCALTLMAPEERFLRGEYPQHGARTIGHNALLELLSSTPDGLPVGTLAIPMSVLPCEDRDCPFCRGGMHAVLGIGCDGYGWGVCSTPPSHLVEVPPSLGILALLADPLASLMMGLSKALSNDRGPVWIAGRTFEAALVAWLAQDAGRPVLHVDRRDWEHAEFPVRAIDPLLMQCRNATLTAPTLAVDFTGSAEVSWPLGQALVEGGNLFVRRRPPGVPQGIIWHELPAAAPNRAALLAALDCLQRWAKFRSLRQRVGPRVPLDLYWDALLPSPFSLPYLDAES